MGFLSNLVDGFFGDPDAPRDAARAQEKLSREAIAETRRSTEQARQDLAPFADTGRETLPGLRQMVENPNAQLDFVQNNPFFNAMADDAQTRIFQNQAARGKLASGETAKALQNSMMLLGNDLVSQNIGQRQNLATLGANAAAGQGSMAVNAGSNISNLLTGIGNAQASGIIGAQNEKAAGANNLVGTALGIGSMMAGMPPGAGAAGGSAARFMISDMRLKQDIAPLGQTASGVPLYSYRYTGQPETHIGPMAQELELLQPEAVLDVCGIKFVDYARMQ